MREERTCQLKKLRTHRITPACAGRTVVANIEGADNGDHPRVCGKNSVSGQLAITIRGSPPRVREERRRYPRKNTRSRITPACAGRTVKKSPFYAFSFSRRFINPFTFVASSLKISTFVLLRCSVLSPIP